MRKRLSLIRELLPTLVVVLLVVAPVLAQITLNYTFTNGTVIDADQVNDNFNNLSTKALNRTGGTATGPVNLVGGGSMAGTWTGNPMFSGDPSFTGNPIYNGAPVFTGGVRLPGAAGSTGTSSVVMKAGSTLTADRTLTFSTGDTARNVTLNGDTTLNDWFDQGVKTTGSPSFTGLAVTGPTQAWRGVTYTMPTTAGTNGQALTTNGSGTLTWAGAGSMGLIKSGNGTSTSATPVNLDVLPASATTGLTQYDTLVFYVEMVAIGGTATSPQVYDSSCNCALSNIIYDGGPGNIAPGTGVFAVVNLRASQYQWPNRVWTVVTTNASLLGANVLNHAWTTPFSIVLRSGGISGGGSLYWGWTAYKVSGQ